MTNNKKAFSLSELFIALTMIIIAIIFMVRTLNYKLPNLDKLKVRNAYSQILKITQNLLNDQKDIYPNASGFADTTEYIDKVLCPNYQAAANEEEAAANEEETENKCPSSLKCPPSSVFCGKTKFTQLFKSKLNIIADEEDNENQNKFNKLHNDKQPVCCLHVDSLYNPDVCIREKIKGYETTCFKTSKNITYCLPKDTTAANCFNSLDPSSGYVIIRAYIDNTYENLTGDPRKKGYYFAVNAAGKVSILSPDSVFEEAYFCANTIKVGGRTIENYNEYDHCKTTDFLLNSKTNQ